MTTATKTKPSPNPGTAIRTLGSTGRRNRTDALVFDDPILAELRGGKALRNLEKMVLDPTIAASLETYGIRMRAAPWTIEPGGEEAIDIDFAGFVEENVRRLLPGWSSVVADCAEALTYGFQLFEIIFTKAIEGSENVRIGDYVWLGFMALDASTIERWDTDPNTGLLLGVYQRGSNGREAYIECWKLFHFRTKPRVGNPQGVPYLRNAYIAWTDRQELRRITKVGLRRDLTGLPMLEVPARILSPNASQDDLAVKADAENLVREVERDLREGLLLPHEMLEDGKPSGWRFTLVTSGGRRTLDLEKYFEFHRQDIAISLLADEILLGHEKSGSWALASSKTNRAAAAVGAWLGILSETAEKTIVPVLQGLNPRYLSAATPDLKAGDIEDLPLDELGAFVSATVGSGAILPDKALDEALRRRAGLPLAQGEEEL